MRDSVGFSWGTKMALNQYDDWKSLFPVRGGGPKRSNSARSESRSLPLRGGGPPHIAAAVAPRTSLPRARGWTVYWTKLTDAAVFVPRPRGWTGRLAGRECLLKVSSPCAGVHRLTSCACCYCGDLFPVRGGGPPLCSRRRERRWSLPRARGWTVEPEAGELEVGVSSPCAGVDRC